MDEQDKEKQVDIEQPASGSIRSAYLARQSHDTGAGGEGETVVATLRGVYVSQVSRQTRRQGDAVKGSEDTGGTVLRSIYAARSETVVIAPRAAPGRKAKAAKKARPARKARPAAKAKVRRAAPAKRRPARKAARRR